MPHVLFHVPVDARLTLVDASLDIPNTPIPNTPIPNTPHSGREFTVLLLGALGIAYGIFLVGRGVDTESVSAGVVCAVIAGLHWTVGRRLIRQPNQRLSLLFLLSVVVLAGGLFQLHPLFGSALFGLYPLCFAAADSRRVQTIAATGLSVAAFMGQAADSGWDRRGLVSGLMIGGVSLFFALTLGRWVERLKHLTERQTVLITELTETRTQLAKSQREIGQREERAHMAAEIHDTLAQGFSSILLVARGARASGPRDWDRTEGYLDMIEATAQTNLDEARALISSLAPVPLQQHGLGQAIDRIAERFQHETGVLCSVAHHSELDIVGGPGEVIVLRGIQESLNNVAKHASASHVRIDLQAAPPQQPPAVVVQVADDGIGFNPSSTQPRVLGHQGLVGLDRRLQTIGGSLAVQSQPGRGTTVRFTVPAQVSS
jgi:signal transduction histidine kinase